MSAWVEDGRQQAEPLYGTPARAPRFHADDDNRLLLKALSSYACAWQLGVTLFMCGGIHCPGLYRLTVHESGRCFDDDAKG